MTDLDAKSWGGKKHIASSDAAGTTCRHRPQCPRSVDANCCSAHVVADHFEQGWCKLCNGVIVFDDGLYLAPDGHIETVPRLLSA